MIRWGRQIFLGLFVLLLIGCGGGTSKSDSGTNNTSALQPDFGIAALPSVTVTPNSQQTISISVTGANGFSNPVNFTLSGLPAGVSASPATFTLTPAASSSDAVKDAGSSTQTSQTVTITSNPQVTAALVAMTVTATSGSITHTAVTPTGQADFALAVPNPALSLTAGSSAPLSISADAFNGFTGQVSVSLSGLPQGVTASPSTVKVTPGAAQTVTLTAAQSMQPTTATITLQGASGSLSHNRELSLAVSEAPPPPDFSLSVTPATLTLQAGGSSEPFTVSATAQNGFTGTIQVALSGLPNGVAAMPATLTLTAGTPQQILLNAASTAPGATKTLTVEAASGSIAHNAALGIVVQPVAPAFSLSLNPGTLSLLAGGAAQQVSVTASAVGSFSSPVNLTLTGLPTGVTATPSTLSLTPGSSQNISLQAASTATAGPASVTFQGTSGSLTQVATMSLTVTAPPPDFQLFAGPSTLNLSVNKGVESMTVALIPLNGFNDAAAVTVSGLPAGVSLAKQPLPLIANIPQSIGLSAGGSATAGQTPITVTATAGGITHTAQVNIVVSAAASDFTPSIFSVTTAGVDSPISGLLLTPGTFQFDIGLSGFGSITPNTVQLSGLPPGTNLDQSQYTFTTNSKGVISTGVFNITTTSSAVGERGVLTLVFTGGQTSHEVDLPVYVVPQPTIFGYIAPLAIRQGAGANLEYETASTSTNGVQIYLGPGWPDGFWLNPYSADTIANLNENSVSASANTATGSLTLPFEFGVDSISQVVPAAAQVVPFIDFSIAAEPQTIALGAAQTQTLTVSASAVNGFSSPVNVSMDDLPIGLEVSPQAFTLEPGTSQTVTLTAGPTYQIGGTVAVDAISGGFSHSTMVAASPGLFTGDLAVTGNSFSGVGIAQIYTSGTYSYALPAVNFPGAALLGGTRGAGPFTSNCGGITTDPNCTPVDVVLWDDFDPGVVADYSGSVQLIVIFDNYGLNGGQSFILPVDVTRPDYALNVSPASLTIPAGGSATLSVTYAAISSTFTQYCTGVFSANPGAASVATLTAPAPLGPIPASVPNIDLCNPQPVTISVPADVPPGNYELTINSQLNAIYEPYGPPPQFDPKPYPAAYIYAAHTYGVPLTVTAAGLAGSSR